ncbi:MAG: hypothetical protein UZ09_BCD002001346 [Bacteroidetes bacterium OLB9]|nr:MAG: hypothetical protein UZ09_BCD002001346 [Bacteroidetes bacterium OLB9]
MSYDHNFKKNISKKFFLAIKKITFAAALVKNQA